MLAGMRVCSVHEAACLQTQKQEDDKETKAVIVNSSGGGGE